MYEVRYYVGKSYFNSRFDSEKEAIEDIHRCRIEGFWIKRKSGIRVYYTAGQIKRMELRPNKRAIRATQEAFQRNQAVTPN